MRLFDGGDSPAADVTSATSWDEIDTILTPYGKGNNFVDSGIGSSAKCSIELPSRKVSRRHSSADVRKSLFCGKRPADTDVEACTPSKRIKDEQHVANITDSALSTNVIKRAVEKLEEHTQIADGSRDYILPTIPGKHSDLKSISADTMADVLCQKYNDRISNVTIVDCRYPYEFESGHIRGAVNLYTKDAVNTLLETPVTSDISHVLIFHCEFSSERGPKMSRFLRGLDRELNKDNYPQLNFPEVYLLHGGYKAFFEAYKNLCDPINYKPMLHEDHAADLRHFRVKSKSWTAGERQVSSRRHRSRFSRLSLEF